jgi:hypothetical protein
VIQQEEKVQSMILENNTQQQKITQQQIVIHEQTEKLQVELQKQQQQHQKQKNKLKRCKKHIKSYEKPQTMIPPRRQPKRTHIIHHLQIIIHHQTAGKIFYAEKKIRCSAW